MIISLYENNFPVRFGIVLYSSKFVMQLENHATKEHSDEDISTTVIFTFCCSGMCVINAREIFLYVLVLLASLWQFFFSFQIICLFSYINENYGAEMAYRFLSNVWVWYLVISVIFSSLSFHDLTDLCLKTLYARSTWLKSKIRKEKWQMQLICYVEFSFYSTHLKTNYISIWYH